MDFVFVPSLYLKVLPLNESKSFAARDISVLLFSTIQSNSLLDFSLIKAVTFFPSIFGETPSSSYPIPSIST